MFTLKEKKINSVETFRSTGFTSEEILKIKQARESGHNFPFCNTTHDKRWNKLPLQSKAWYFDEVNRLRSSKTGLESAVNNRSLENSVVMPGVVNPELQTADLMTNCVINVADFSLGADNLSHNLDQERNNRLGSFTEEAKVSPPLASSKIPILKITKNSLSSNNQRVLSIPQRSSTDSNCNYPGANCDQTYKIDDRWNANDNVVMRTRRSFFQGVIMSSSVASSASGLSLNQRA